MKFCLVVILILLASFLKGQSFTMVGVVTDEMGSPLKRVNIFKSGNENSGTSSGADGYFSLWCNNDDTLIFSHIACETRRIPANTLSNTQNPASNIIVLKSRSFPLKQVTISEKRDHRFRYLLDFETINEDILKLEIHGRQKFLSLYSPSEKLYWKCLLPVYLNKCNHLGRDFLSNIYLHSEDTLYQIKADTSLCQIMQGIPRYRYQYIMDPCVGWLSSGILVKRFGEYNQSVTLVIRNKSQRTLIYTQEDVLARMHCSDLDNVGSAHAGLGFQMVSPDEKNNHPASLSRQFALRGSGRSASSKGISKPISVESFCMQDTIYVYDHSIDQMFIFNSGGKLINQGQITHNNKEFLRKYLIDENEQMVYGVFRNKKGIYLQPINYRNGKPVGAGKSLDIYFYEKVRIVNNQAIYMQYDHLANSRWIKKSAL
ncbi:MAG: hypothetical protein IPH84_06620 [Bacteroidales bacterium]|nr:hypothetical protein [Bacteroidales bacterium]